MRFARSSVTVDRPIHDVFHFLAEGRNNPIWRSDVSLAARVVGTGTDLGVGAAYFQKVVDRRGRAVDETYEISRCEPPHLLEFTAARDTTRTIGRYTLAAIDPGTTHVEFTLRRVSRDYRVTRRSDDRSQLQDRVDSIAALPTAMRDEGALPL